MRFKGFDDRTAPSQRVHVDAHIRTHVDDHIVPLYLTAEHRKLPLEQAAPSFIVISRRGLQSQRQGRAGS